MYLYIVVCNTMIINEAIIIAFHDLKRLTKIQIALFQMRLHHQEASKKFMSSFVLGNYMVYSLESLFLSTSYIKAICKSLFTLRSVFKCIYTIL
jgi:hypothetical protein